VPGIDFVKARARISLADVLSLIGFVPVETSGDQVRGPCPLHPAMSTRSRSFSANLKRHIYMCFKCGSAGNQLDLYARVSGLSLLEATIDLCRRRHTEIPWIHINRPGLARAGQVARSIGHSDHRARTSRPKSDSPDSLKDQLSSDQLSRPMSGQAKDSDPARVNDTTGCDGSRRNR